ncbi:taurine catabolism dioxygenase [Meredithblackwellia eburnea MCA 4105]
MSASSNAQTTILAVPPAGAVGSLVVRASHEPLQRNGALDKYEHHDSNPVIGTEISGVQLSALIEAADGTAEGDAALRDLAVLVQQRGVVFFRGQDEALKPDELKKLANKLGTLSGRPEASGLHIHPTEHKPDLELSPINQNVIKRYPNTSHFASRGWHTDITFEKHPSDFAILNMHTLPQSGGGDTIWASAYEAYDRLTPALAKFLEGLTAVHDGNRFYEIAKARNIEVFTGVRGNPLNKGEDLKAVHPVIRTNPITGYKGLFVQPGFTRRILELNLDESEVLLQYLFRLIADNHDLQVRFTWKTNDVAIWSNISTFHNVTLDYKNGQIRSGNRVVSIGEAPYLDKNSKSRREALGLPAWSE